MDHDPGWNPIVTQGEPMERKLLTYEQACKKMSISRRTLYRIIAEGELIPVKIRSGIVRLKEGDVDAFIESSKTPNK